MGSRARIVSAAIAGGMLLVLLVLTLLPGGESSTRDSVFSTKTSGRRAVFLLLERLGWEAKAWTRPPGDLDRGEHVVWLGNAPELPPGHGRGGATGSRDPLHYLTFLEEGGTLVVPLHGDPMRDFVVETLGVLRAEDASATTKRDRTSFLLPWGEAMEVRPSRMFHPLTEDSPFEPFMADEEGYGFVLRMPVERGELVALSDAAFMRNTNLPKKDCALAAVRLFESIAPGGGTVYFDEYSLGGWVPETAIELAFGPRARGLTLHFLAFALIALAGVVWVRGFPRDPVPYTLLSPLDRARSWAALLVAEKRWALLAKLLRGGVLRRLARRAGAGREASSGEGDALNAEAVTALLVGFRTRLGGDEGIERARALFLERPVGNEAQLAKLGDDLARLEHELGMEHASTEPTG